MNSRIPGFYERSPTDRLEIVRERCDLSTEAEEDLGGDVETVDRLSENVVGSIAYPLSVATNFTIDGEDVLIPMTVEESSVVAAASHGAKLARETGGFTTTVTEPRMIGQIQVIGIADPRAAKARVLEREASIRELANDQGVLVDHGGGCEGVEVRVLETPRGEMLRVHLLVDVRDAMGANAVNTMVEAVAPEIEAVTGGEVSLRVLSNLADRRLARARCRIDPAAFEREDASLAGTEVRDRIADAWAFAAADPYRTATHNKGIMNGVDAVAAATLSDWRALEAGAHAYAARGEGYGPLTSFEVDDEGFLAGTIELPIQVGTVGGATRSHPTSRAAMEILDVESATEFAGVLAAVGLAQNVASLRALVAEGIQSGHMKLHAENVAAEAGATGGRIQEIAARMVAEDDVRHGRARELIDELSVED